MTTSSNKDYSQSLCYTNTNAMRPHFGISSSSMNSPSPTRQGIGFLNTNWTDPKFQGNVPDTTPPFPCQLFYDNANDVSTMDVECWNCIRGQILEVSNKNKDRQSTSCINNPCKDLTLYSDTTVPLKTDMCGFIDCVKNNRTSCTDGLYYAVFGNDANANAYSSQNCKN